MANSSITKLRIPDEWRSRWENISPQDYQLVLMEYNRQILDELIEIKEMVGVIRGYILFFVVLTILSMILWFFIGFVLTY